jgi:acetyltransferase
MPSYSGICQMNVNPSSATPQDFVALDARTVLHSPALIEAQPPCRAIRPQYVQTWAMPDGTRVTVRPIRPEDEPLMRDFHKALSEQTVYLRYFHMVQLGQRVAHEPLSRLCFIDFDRETALVVEGRDPARGRRAILAVGRLSRMPTSGEAEFDLLVDDAYQRHGLGSELLRRLIEIGRAQGLRRITATMLRDNYGMRRTCQKLGFQLKYVPEDQAMVARLEL